MAKYAMSVRDFLKESGSGGLDLEDFYGKLHEELARLDRKFSLFSALANPGSPGKGMLCGLPISVKDNICVKGLQSATGSKILEGYKPPFDATAVSRAKSAGGVIIGKTNQDEFGFGTFSTNSGFGIPKNPLDAGRSCGGSSGGAAGLVKALEFPNIAIAESTGGSISCPASFCGVAGLTPTYGLVSRHGLIDYANSLDKIGAIGKSVHDVSLMLSIIACHDPKDPTSIAKKQEDYAKPAPRKKMKIGVPKEYFQGIDDGVSKAVWSAIKKLEGEGHTYKEISLPYTKHSLYSYYIIATAESSTNLAKFSGMRYGASGEMAGKNFNNYFSEIRTKYFGEEAKRRILLGTFTRMAGYRNQYYLKAMKVRTLVIREFKSAFKKADALLAPSMPITAPKFSEIEKLSPLEHYMMDVLTVAPNLAGIPMLSVPCGSANGMPVGLHIMGDHLHEDKIISLGSEAEGL